MKTQQHRQDLNDIAFKDGESIDYITMRMSSTANNLRILGDYISDTDVVKKLLQVMPDRLSQVAWICIETLLDLNTLSIEECTGRLRVAE